MDKIDDKLDKISESVVRLETIMTERSKLWGKNTIKLLAAVVLAVASAMGINAACTDVHLEYECIDSGVMDAGDGGD